MLILLSLMVFLLQEVKAATCDNNNYPVLVTSAGGTTAYNETADDFIAYGEPF